MEFQKVTNQEVFNAFLSSIDWEHAFIREIYALSPSYITTSGNTVAPDAPANIALIIITFDLNKPVIELKLEKVAEVRISFVQDISPNCRITNNGFKLYLNQDDWVETNIIFYRVLKEEGRGDRVRYGNYWDRLFREENI